MRNDDGGESFRLLFVCSGNTCRSPLAEALARSRLHELGWRVEVRSAGMAAVRGEPASEGSVRAAARHGLDLSGHRSRPFDSETSDWADLILAMSPGHLLRLVEMGAGGKAALLDAFAQGEDGGSEPAAGVPDPFGGDDDAYEETYRMLEELVTTVLRRLEPILAP